MATQTPWGESQGDAVGVIHGLRIYSTASHGGVALARGLWYSLSEQAIELGIEYGGRLWFEEDCAWAIPGAAPASPVRGELGMLMLAHARNLSS